MKKNPRNKFLTARRGQLWVLLFCIFVAQLATASLLDNLSVFSKAPWGWRFFYSLLAFLAAIPQAGFSDVRHRKTHLLISIGAVCLLCIFSLVASYSVAIGDYGVSYLVTLPICFLLGILGNVIPIARGCIVVLKTANFRVSIGMTTVAIAFGWVFPEILHTMPGLRGYDLVISTILVLASYVLVWKYYLHGDHHKRNGSKLSNLEIIGQSYKWTWRIAVIPGGVIAFLAYLCSESSFYPIYFRDVLPGNPFAMKFLGIFIAVVYTTGVLIQYFLKWNDTQGITRGIKMSLFSMLLLLACVSISESLGNIISFVLKSVFTIGFVIGFGWFTPSLFSVLSKRVHSEHAGRLYGVIDSTDTAALAISSAVVFSEQNNYISNIEGHLIASIVFIVAAVLYFCFSRKIKVFESKIEPKSDVKD